MSQTAPPAIAAPVPLGTEVTAGPLTLRLEEAVAAEATGIVASLNDQNDPPPAGLDYVLARITVTNTGTTLRTVTASDFAATGTDGVVRRCPSFALPDPPLDAAIEPGASFAGWTGGLVNDVGNVVLLFDPAIPAGDRFAATFALTEGATVPAFDIAAGEGVDATLESPAGLGDPVRSGLWELTVNETIGSATYFELSDYRVRALGAPNADGSGWQTLGLDVTVRNITDSPQFFSWTTLELVDTNGEPWDHLLATAQPEPPASVMLLPGATVTGWYGIWLETWATTSLLRVRDSILTEDFRFISLDGSSGSAPTASEEPAPEPVELAPGDAARVGADALNMRDAASTDGELVAELDPGTALTVLGDPIEADGYQWYEVSVDETGETGFVAGSFLEPADE